MKARVHSIFSSPYILDIKNISKLKAFTKMTTEEKKQKTAEKLAAARTKRTTTPSQRVNEMPLLIGDTITFVVPEGGCAGDLYDVNTDGVEFDFILDKKGRRVSVKSLVGRKGNGIDVEGETRDERCNAFLALLDEKGEISYKVENLRVLPSTRADWDSQRIVNWAKA